jgi:hypothetical protein
MILLLSGHVSRHSSVENVFGTVSSVLRVVHFLKNPWCFPSIRQRNFSRWALSYGHPGISCFLSVDGNIGETEDAIRARVAAMTDEYDETALSHFGWIFHMQWLGPSKISFALL